LHITHPALLLLIALLPLFAVLALLVTRLRSRQWTAFVADRLRPALLKADSPLPRWLSLAALLAAALCLIIALSRPYANLGSRTEKIMGRNVIIAIDLSRSMRVADVKPDRLSQAKIIGFELIESLPNERIGLIGFAGNAALSAPLTVDHAAVRETLEQMDESWVTLGGTNLTKTIQLAVETFRETGQRNNALVILSDGEKHEKNIDDAIQAARQAGVRIIAIGIGTEDGDYVPNKDFPGNRMVGRDGKPILSSLHKDVLSRIATETNGTFATAGAGSHIPTLVRNAINRIEAFEIEGRERAIRIEFYQWLTFPAVLLLILSIVTGTRWRKITTSPLASTALILIATSTLLPAATEADARKALLSGDHPRASSLYQKLAAAAKSSKRKAAFHLAAAISAYHADNLPAAQLSFSKAILSPNPAVVRNAHFGYGNSLFQQGWKRIFNARYPAPSEEPPTMSSFDDAVRTLLRGSPDQESSIVPQIEFIVQSWTDAIRHFNSAIALDPQNPDTLRNRDLTFTYLKRLAELIKEDEQQARESLPEPTPEPQPDENQGNEGQSEGDDKKDDNKNDGKNPDGSPEQSQNPDNPAGDPENRDGNPDPNQPPKQRKDPGESDPSSGKAKPRPDESPEDHARRQLKESADLERGPLTPGRREFMPPEKDW